MRGTWLRTTISISLITTLAGCGGGENPQETEVITPVLSPIPPTPVEPEEPPAPVASLDLAITNALFGDANRAIEMLSELIAVTPDDSTLWQTISQIAVSSGQADDLLARLDATTAIGGAEDSHHRLRAELAIASGSHRDAVESVARLSDAEEKVAFQTIISIALGEAIIDPESISEDNAAKGLIDAYAARSRSQKRRILQEMTPSHWRAQILQADMLIEIGDEDAAIAIYTSLLSAGAGHPASIYSNEALRGMLQQGEDDIYAEPLTEAAFATGDLNLLLNSVSTSVEMLMAQESPDEALILAQQAWDAHNAPENDEPEVEAPAPSEEAATEEAATEEAATEEAATEEAATEPENEEQGPVADSESAESTTTEPEASTNSESLSMLSALVATAALNTGRPDISMEYAEISYNTCLEDDVSCLLEADYLTGISAWQLGDVESLLTILNHGNDARNSIAVMHQTMIGSGTANSASTITTSTSNSIANHALGLIQGQVDFMTNGTGVSHMEDLSNSARMLSDKSGEIEALLMMEHYASMSGDARSRGIAISRLSSDDLVNNTLRVEISARQVMAGAPPMFPGTGLGHETAWHQLSSLEGILEQQTGEHPITSWARARALAVSGDTEGALAAYTLASAGTPPHMRGPWTPLAKLRGGDGSGIEAEMDLVSSAQLSTGLVSLPIHDWAHEASLMDTAFATGDAPYMGLSDDERVTLNTAHRRLQTQSAQWLAGFGEEPTEEELALNSAIVNAMETTSFSRALPGVVMDYTTVQEELRGWAIISFHFGPTELKAALITQTGSSTTTLGNSAEIARDLADYRTTILQGDARGGPAMPSGASSTHPVAIKGDALRQTLLDPFEDQLQGIGRYLLIIEHQMWGFTMGALPEQRDAARFMADIRSFTSSHTVSHAFSTPTSPSNNFSADLLGMSPFPPNNSGVTDRMSIGEMVTAARQFGQGVRVIGSEEEALVGTFSENAPTARYIHLSDVRPGDSAGIEFFDGTASLASIREAGLTATVVVISQEAEPRVLSRQAHALATAGATYIITSSWLVDEGARGRFLYNFYEAMNRDRPAYVALGEARTTAAAEGNNNGYFDPSWWAQYVLYGRI
jgi:hypothetical protein